jgi:hypothetical protein
MILIRVRGSVKGNWLDAIYKVTKCKGEKCSLKVPTKGFVAVALEE